MASKSRHPEPKIVRPDDVDPRHRWDRPLQAPGRTQVDFEERVDFRRLHDYRLARTRAALSASGLGALLCFDQHNIRYTTSTVIGEWARDKLTRYSLLTGNGDPYIWDFGSAARHHKLYAPWLHTDHCRAGLLGLRGATGADLTLFRDAAKEIKAILDAEGVGDMPVGVDGGGRPGGAADAVRAAESRHRGARQPAGDAGSARSQEHRRDHAAQHGRGDGGRGLPGHRRGAEARRAGVADRGARHQASLRDGLGLRRGDQLDFRRALLAAPAQFYRPPDPAGRSGVL